LCSGLHNRSRVGEPCRHLRSGIRPHPASLMTPSVCWPDASNG
jgi:hypothetical protein